ncbi:hypothetical protein A2U01_0112352, partial [Trifolium medium]|nr:hypothetical protein [Trifolium medium]
DHDADQVESPPQNEQHIAETILEVDEKQEAEHSSSTKA